MFSKGKSSSPDTSSDSLTSAKSSMHVIIWVLCTQCRSVSLLTLHVLLTPFSRYELKKNKHFSSCTESVNYRANLFFLGFRPHSEYTKYTHGHINFHIADKLLKATLCSRNATMSLS